MWRLVANSAAAAHQYGFTSKSHGKGDNRCVTVYKVRARVSGSAPRSAAPSGGLVLTACGVVGNNQATTFRPAHTLDAYDLNLCPASCAALNSLFSQHPPTTVSTLALCLLSVTRISLNSPSFSCAPTRP